VATSSVAPETSSSASTTGAESLLPTHLASTASSAASTSALDDATLTSESTVLGPSLLTTALQSVSAPILASSTVAAHTQSSNNTPATTYTSTLEGLESLGPVQVLLQEVVLGVPSSTNDTAFALPPPYDSLRVLVPAGAWPVGRRDGQGRALTATVFALPAGSGTPGVSCGPGVDLGPHELTLALSIMVSVRCEALPADMHGKTAGIFALDLGGRGWVRRGRPSGGEKDGGGVLWAETQTLTAHMAFLVPDSTGMFSSVTVYAAAAAVGGTAVIGLAAACIHLSHRRRIAQTQRSKFLPLAGMSRVEPLSEDSDGMEPISAGRGSGHTGAATAVTEAHTISQEQHSPETLRQSRLLRPLPPVRKGSCRLGSSEAASVGRGDILRADSLYGLSSLVGDGGAEGSFTRSPAALTKSPAAASSPLRAGADIGTGGVERVNESEFMRFHRALLGATSEGDVRG